MPWLPGEPAIEQRAFGSEKRSECASADGPHEKHQKRTGQAADNPENTGRPFIICNLSPVFPK
jgi:hypothetical protein